jgi:hypothetical protein
MFTRKFVSSALVSSCLLTGLIGTGLHVFSRPNDRMALLGLSSAFHGASPNKDAALMRSIWAKDAVFRGGGNVVRGRDKIVEFFTGDENWGKTANLTSAYKTIMDIHGNKATMKFECIIVKVDDSSPLTTSLSTLPPKSQNPKVEIIQHSTATIQAVKKRGQWLIQTFSGAGGPIK